MRHLAACALAMLSFAAAASADPVNFDSDSIGNKSEPFTSVDSPLVHFYDTSGNNLRVDNFGGSHALFVPTNSDFSALEMRFDLGINALWLDFGNDLASLTSAGDVAVLTAYDGSSLVGYSVVALNRNGLLDQSIGFVGGTFNKAYFYYANSALPILPFTIGSEGLGLTEVVDNIFFGGNYNNFDTAPYDQNTDHRVPEPTMLALSGVGALLVAWRRRRKTA